MFKAMTMAVAVILVGSALHYGHYVFIAAATLLAAGIAAAVIVTLKKRKTTVAPASEIEPFYDEAFPSPPDQFSFLRDLGFDPYKEPEFTLAEDQDFSGNENISEELGEILTGWYKVLARQESYRRQMTALGSRHNHASDCLAFLSYLQLRCEQLAKALTEADEKGNAGQLLVLQKMEERNNEIQKGFKAHNQEIWSAVENLRSRIIANDAELFRLKGELETLRRQNADVPIELTKALRQFGNVMRYEALIPLLHSINRAFAESEKTQQSIRLAESRLTGYTVRLEGVEKQIRERKDAKGDEYLQSTAQWLAVAVKLFEAVIGAHVAHRKTLADDYLIHKKAADDYLNSQQFSIDEIISNEDRVIGQIAYETTRQNIIRRKKTAEETYVQAEREYALCLSGKRRFSRKREQERQEQERRIEAASAALKAARAERAAADEDIETELPRLNPVTLIKSGSGIISQELLSALNAKAGKRTFCDYIEDVYRVVKAFQVKGDILYTRDPQDYFNESAIEEPELEAEALPEPPSISEQYPLSGPAISQRLDELVKKTEGTSDPGSEKPRGRGAAQESPEVIEKVNKRIAEIMRLRRRLKYIDNEKESKAFNYKLNQLIKSFDEDEKSNVALGELVKRTKSMAVYLGKKGKPE